MLQDRAGKGPGHFVRGDGAPLVQISDIIAGRGAEHPHSPAGVGVWGVKDHLFLLPEDVDAEEILKSALTFLGAYVSCECREIKLKMGRPEPIDCE